MVPRIIRWGRQKSLLPMRVWWPGGGIALIVFQAVGHERAGGSVSSAVDAYDGQVDWWSPCHKMRVDP